MIPQVLNRIKIRRTCSRAKLSQINFVFFHPIFCIGCSMWWSIVVHINPIIIICIKSILNKHRQCFFNYVDISRTIQFTTIRIINGPRAPPDMHPHTLTTPPPPCTRGTKLNDSLISDFNRRTKT